MIVSRVLILVCALLGALGHAKLTQRQLFRSKRTVFDVVATGIFAVLLVPLGLDVKLTRLFGLADWLPPLLDLPYEAQAGVMLMGGYVFASALPNLIALVNSLGAVLERRFGFAFVIPLPDTGVITVAKPPLKDRSPEGILARGEVIQEKVADAVKRDTVATLERVATAAPAADEKGAGT